MGGSLGLRLLLALNVCVIVAWSTSGANSGAVLDHGNTSLANEQEPKAFQSTTAATRLDRMRAALLVKRASEYLEKKDYEKAIADFSEAIRLDPKNGKAYAGRACCWVDNARKRDVDLAEAGRLDPAAASDATDYIIERKIQEIERKIEERNKLRRASGLEK